MNCPSCGENQWNQDKEYLLCQSCDWRESPEAQRLRHPVTEADYRDPIDHERATHCPRCKSTNWRCYDEWNEYFEDSAGEQFNLPVGGLVCKDCDLAWDDWDWTEEDGITPLVRIQPRN